jgi:hypothetical protein
MMFFRRILLVAACCLSWTAVAAAEPLTAWLTLDDKIGPGRPCEGELSVDGDKLVIKPWMDERKDSVDGGRFQIATEQNAKTADAAKLGTAYRTTLPKGLLLEIDGHAEARLRGKTNLGDLDIPLDRLRQNDAVTVLDGKVRLQRLPNVTRLTGDQAEEEYPSIAMLPDGRTAVAYVSWDGVADRVWLRRGDKVQLLTEKPGDYLDPRCAVDVGGNLWVVWATSEAGRWDLWAWSASGGGRVQRLTSGPQNNFWPRLARDARGRLWVAWQSVGADLHYEIMLAQLSSQGLSSAVNVSQHDADDWEPALCATPDGRLVVAWDTYRHGSFDIYLREFKADADGRAQPLGPAKPVAASAKREAHASVAADRSNRVWIAWDVSNENWGNTQPVATPSIPDDRSTWPALCPENSGGQRPVSWTRSPSLGACSSNTLTLPSTAKGGFGSCSAWKIRSIRSTPLRRGLGGRATRSGTGSPRSTTAAAGPHRCCSRRATAGRRCGPT